MQLQMHCIYRCVIVIITVCYRLVSTFQLITIKQFANEFQFLLIFDGNQNEMLWLINMENKTFSSEIVNSSRNCSPAAMPNQVTGLTFLSLSRGDCARYSQEKLRKFGTCESRVRKWNSVKK